jgi:hypothetical protein
MRTDPKQTEQIAGKQDSNLGSTPPMLPRRFVRFIDCAGDTEIMDRGPIRHGCAPATAEPSRGSSE